MQYGNWRNRENSIGVLKPHISALIKDSRSPRCTGQQGTWERSQVGEDGHPVGSVSLESEEGMEV